jgi:NAD(P)-dependent dehydrogenase (short-subunit alcohol dehydrogenase family)
MSRGRVAGKVVMITGATAGIGRGCAIALAREGASVVATGRNEVDGARTVELLREAGGEGIYLRQDVTSDSDWPAVLNRAIAAYGRLDCLINNAGQMVARPIDVLTLDNFRYQTELIIDACFLGMKYAMPRFDRLGGGLILNVASVGGLRGGTVTSIYGPCKAAMIMLGTVAAREGTANGRRVRVNTICPGHVLGERYARKNGPESTKRRNDMAIALSALKMIGEPSDVGELAVYLVSDEARAINGQTLILDGGAVL